MKILHVTPTFYPAHFYGGPIQSVYALCRHLSRLGSEVRVLTTNANGPKELDIQTEEETQMDDGVSVRYCRRTCRPDLSSSMFLNLASYVRWADVVHITYVFSASSLAALGVSKAAGRPVVWSPRGSLQPYCMRGKRTPKRAWMVACKSVRPRKLALHVTSEDEKRDLKAFLPGVPAYVVSNGVDVPTECNRSVRSSSLRVLYLGRIHPIKGIENLISACASTPAVELTIAGGGDDSYIRTLQRQVAISGAGSRVHFPGEVVGNDKEDAFRGADVLVLPSYSENFGLVVAEALARGVPVIASRGTPWSRIEDVGCGLYVGNDPQSLSSALCRIGNLPLHEMGARGRAWMQSDYTWEAQTGQMLGIYHDLTSQ